MLEDLNKYLRFNGTANRTEYWVIYLATIVFAFVAYVAYVATEGSNCSGLWDCGRKAEDAQFDLLMGRSSEHVVLGVFAGNPNVLYFLAAPVWIISCYLYLAAGARRLKDIGWNPWLIVATGIPYLGIILSIIVGLLPTKKT